MNKAIQIKRIYDRYEITSTGELSSYCYNKKRQLKPGIRSRGYYSINICINKKKYTKYIHRLIAEAFIPNPNNYPQINHKDGNKLNNNLNNLEWCTNKQNQIHARDTGLKPKTCKIDMTIAEEIRKLYKTGSYKYRELCEMFNIHQVNVGCVIRNKIWVK